MKRGDPVTTCMKETTNLSNKRKTVKPSKSTVKDIAKNIYSKINEPFKNLNNIDLALALTKIPEIGITMSKTKAQKKKERRDTGRQFKKVTEENSGPKLTATPCLGPGNPTTRQIQRENLCTLSLLNWPGSMEPQIKQRLEKWWLKNF